MPNIGKKGVIIAACGFFVLALIFATVNKTFCQTKYEKLKPTTKNIQGGYNFYGSSGQRSGYSKVDRMRGGYIYYDEKGNPTGRLVPRRRGRNSYIYYDADGVRRGVVKKTQEGTYIYSDSEGGNIIETIPEVQGEVGSISPGTLGGVER